MRYFKREIKKPNNETEKEDLTTDHRNILKSNKIY